MPCHMWVERVVLPSPNAPTKYQLMFYLSLIENNKTTSNRQMNKYFLSVAPCVDIACSVALPWLLVQSC